MRRLGQAEGSAGPAGYRAAGSCGRALDSSQRRDPDSSRQDQDRRSVASRGPQRSSAHVRDRRTRAGDLGKAKALRPRAFPSSSHSQAGRPLATLRLAAGAWPAAAAPELRPNGDRGGRGGPGVQALEGALKVFPRPGSEESLPSPEGQFLTSDS